MRLVLKRPLLHDDAAAVITTRLMMLAAAGARIFSNTKAQGLVSALSSVQGTSAMMTTGTLLTSCRHSNGDSLPGAPGRT